MKQFLRYIFTLAAIFAATANAWAECYTLEKYTTDSEGYITVRSDRDGSSFSESFRVTNGYELTFSYCLSGSTDVSYDHYVAPQFSTDGSNFSDILPENTISTKSRAWRHTKNDDNLTFILPSGTTHIRFRRRASSWFGTRDVYIKNIRVTRKSFATVSPTTFSFDPIPVGTTTTKKVTINYSNIGTSVYASACDPADVATHFALTSADNLDCAGFVELILTYQPQSEGNHGGTATISGSNGTSTMITISGSAYNKVNPTHTWSANTTFKVDDPNLDLSSKWGSNNTEGKITYSIESFIPSGENNEGATIPAINGASLSLGQAGTLVLKLHQAHSEGFNEWTSKQTITINKYDVDASISQSSALRNEIINNPFSLSYGLTDFIVESKNTNIAEYHESTKQIQTYFTDGTASFLITRPEDYKYNALNQIVELVVKANTGTCYILEDLNERNWETIDNSGLYTIPSGIPNTLIFQARRTDILGFTNTTEFYAEYSSDKNTWHEATKINLPDESTWYDLKCDIPETAKYVRFVTYTGATGNKHIRNVRVTRKTFLNPQIDGETFYLTQVSSGMQFAGTFPLAWSTCSDEIRFSCDNPNFTIIPSVIDASNGQDTTSIIITYSADTDNPDLTGELTIYDQSQTKTITLSCEHMLQTIDWPQYFYNLEADENGYINEDITLNAIARTVTGLPTGKPIQYTLSVSPANASLSTDANNKTHLHITGTCEGTITASVEGFTDSNGRTYSASTLTRQIRIRKAGTPCHSYALYIVDLQTITLTNSTKIFSINGLPENSMTFIAHTDVLSVSNDLSIDFSKDGNTWGDKQTIDIKPGYEHSTYSCPVPDSISFIRFRTGSTLRTFFDMVTIRQKEYLTASVSEIVISDAIVNQPFSATFTVDYSDVPFIQYEVTNNHNLNIQLTPSPEINNNCGEHGTYTFTLTGMSPYPQENVQETITIFTSAGHRVEIPVIITSKLGDPYYFNQQDGNWNDLNNWRVNNTKPSQLPTPSNPIFISKAATIGTNDAPFEGIAYSITIAVGGSLTVLPTGGLTVYAGGFTGANENNLTLHNMQSGAGFIRISPYFTREVEGTMPKIKVLYQTKSTLDSGANKDATWQYIGAPGNNTTIYVDYNTWLYKLDEQNADWVLQPRTANVALEPFEGYAITQYGQPTYQWTADITNENHTLPLTYSKDGRDGRHIFANSYTAPIDVKALHNAITYAEGQESRFRIDQTVYIFNSGSWNAWNSIGQTASGSTPGQYYAIPILAAAADYLSSDEQTVIPPMQGFYMRVRSKTPMNELKTNEHVGHIQLDYNQLVMSNKQIDNTPLRSPQRVEDTSDFQRARIHVTSATSGADRLIIIQDTINTCKYNNGYDAPNQTTEGLANIYTNESFGKMEVSCSDNIDSLYIGFMAGEDSYYTLHFSAMCGEIYLKDLANDSIILMQDGGQYHFTATPNSTNDLRFQILLDPDFDPSNGNGDILSDTEGAPSTQVWMHGNTIYIASAPSNSVAKLFNVSGHMIMNAPITYSPYTLDLSHLTPGVYMLQLNNQTYKFIRQ